MTREDAISIMNVIVHMLEEKYDTDRVEEAVDMAIKALEQEPKTGHWIVQPSNKEQGERDFIWWKCSECGQVIYSETEKDRKEFHAFCSRCGVKMIEPQESETWEGIHEQVTAPKGTFDKIWNEAEDNDEI